MDIIYNPITNALTIINVMNITDIAYNILLKLETFEIVKCSSVNIWMEKLNHDFCYDGNFFASKIYPRNI